MGNESDVEKHFIRLERGFWVVVRVLIAVVVFAVLRHIVYLFSDGSINPPLWKFSGGLVVSAILLVISFYVIGYFVWDFWIDVAGWLDRDGNK